ncbi:MAG: DUF1542 domain-containing protein [Corynebacterium sp.]|nr:DUF1542 domain-containing protein [Corynebacterium sp.]
MNSTFLLLILAIAAIYFFAHRTPRHQPGQTIHRGPNAQAIYPGQVPLDDAIAEARHWIDRLGSQVLQLSGADTASTQALADASERFNAASAQISTAQSVRQAELAREAALEGLYYVQAAREIMGMPAGPALPQLEGQRQAGAVSETRQVEVEGRTLTTSPTASASTPNYYPGGTVAGRPVPAGWYSEPWWKSAMVSGMWTAGSVLLFSSLFSGMSGVASAESFAAGYDAALDDMVDMFGMGDMGDLGGVFGGGFDFGGFDF